MITPPLSRRLFVTALAAVASPMPGLALPLEDDFADVEAKLGGRLGVWAGSVRTDAALGHRQDERFAMASSFKWLLAAAVLERVDQGRERLDRTVAYAKSDLIGHSPVTAAHLAEGHLPVSALAEAAVTQSDNGAANLLLESVGGPAALTAFLRRHGDGVTRLDRNEPELNTAIPGDPRDTTTPRAMAGNLRRLLFGNALTPASRDRLRGWLIANRTGDARIRAGLPAGLTVGDKTGTGERGAIGDVGFVLAPTPGRTHPLIVAVYLQAPSATPDAREAAIARCASIVWRRLAMAA
ncbi:MAG TPA: class A beta-lactamase [Caulobacteraceae bacterium]|jgi:beta-lactamase class A|nr:class A beta-lactamase [Caulobacteraceae bacterium]